MKSYSGKPYDIGYTYGSINKKTIHSYTSNKLKKIRNLISQTEIFEKVQRVTNDVSDSCPNTYSELRGISDSTGISIINLNVVVNYTDFIDCLQTSHSQEERINCEVQNCSSSIVLFKRGYCSGQTWDMPGDVIPKVLRKKYLNQNNVICFAPQIPLSHIGYNGKMYVGTNNIRCDSKLEGIGFACIINEILATMESVSEAVEFLKKTKRLSGHNYTLLDKNDGIYVEALQDSISKIELDERESQITHTNHTLVKKMDNLPGDSEERYNEMSALHFKSHFEIYRKIRKNPVIFKKNTVHGVKTQGISVCFPRINYYKFKSF